MSRPVAGLKNLLCGPRVARETHFGQPWSKEKQFRQYIFVQNNKSRSNKISGEIIYFLFNLSYGVDWKTKHRVDCSKIVATEDNGQIIFI